MATKEQPEAGSVPGWYLSEARDQTGQTQLALAFSSKRGINTISRWENSWIDRVTWLGLLAVLGLPSDWQPPPGAKERHEEAQKAAKAKKPEPGA